MVRHELIGLRARVAKSTDPSQKGVSGKIVDETFNTIVIETKNGEKRLPKENCVFVVRLPDSTRVEIDGSVIIGRPEDRIKKKFQKW